MKLRTAQGFASDTLESQLVAPQMTPLDLAAVAGRESVVEEMLRYKPNLDRTNAEGQMVAHIAARGGSVPVMKVAGRSPLQLPHTCR